MKRSARQQLLNAVDNLDWATLEVLCEVLDEQFGKRCKTFNRGCPQCTVGRLRNALWRISRNRKPR